MKKLSFIIFIALILSSVLLITCEEQPTEPQRDNILDPNNPETGGDPFNLTAQIAGGGIQLIWQTVSVGSVVGYNVYRKVDYWNFNLLVEIDSLNTSLYTDTDIQNGHKYTYYIVTRNEQGEESTSNTAHIEINNTPCLSIDEGEYTSTREVNLTLLAFGAEKMQIGTPDLSGAQWMNYTTIKTVELSSGDGTKVVKARFAYPDEDTSGVVSDNTILDTHCAIDTFYWNSTAEDTLVPYDVIEIRLFMSNDEIGAETGGTAQVDLNGIFENFILPDQNNGNYSGSYDVQVGDEIENGTIILSFTDRAGNEISPVSAADSVNIITSTFHIPGDYPTIQAGIDAASNGDTVLIANGTYTGAGNKNIDFSGKPITVMSENGPDNCVIDCENDGRGFYFHSGEDSNSSLIGLTIINGYVSDSGGGINCTSNSNPTISYCIISGNMANPSGGGIHCYESNPIIGNCTIIGNTAEYNGGGIHLNNSSPAISNCFFTGNSIATTDGGGGGIFCSDNASPTIDGCTISENTAQYGGGIVFSDSSNATISNTTIELNSATEGGGGIQCWSSSPTIDSCTISGNTAIENGGGIECNNSSSPNIINCVFTDNSANNCGGGILCYQSSPTIDSCTISGNTAQGGGGIQCSDTSDIIISNCTIDLNSATWGGAINCGESNPTITKCTITGNSATESGGGISCYQSSPTIDGCDINGNTSNWGGGIVCNYYSSMIIENSNINENSAVNSHGGGINCHDNSSIDIEYCTISGNTTGESGGGIICHVNSSLNISNCTISGNSSNGGSGGIHCDGSSAIIVNTIVDGNLGNGGIFLWNFTAVSISYSDFNNNENGNFTGSPPPDLGQITTTNANGDPCDVYYNIFLGPLFVDPANGDFHLQWGSPCIDAGDPASPLDPDGTVSDIGAFYYQQ